ncbi:lysosomal thioesterase PPT2-A-like [Xyrichtys novacula]|uniref:palmitoyl-CoA hydrolase n=1 Tax=Xyrichtys novacula TaxID=13765 RepID=A0AAV1FRF5_XYRNO|nr:lysosomal thioesterase PPT2-A-like [Xyrichtys novacula]
MDFSSVWKKSFLRIKNLVLIGGPDDGVITPWQSSFFGFYDKKENVVEMKDQRFYRKNLFGLKKLDARGGISMCVRPGVKHSEWILFPGREMKSLQIIGAVSLLLLLMGAHIEGYKPVIIVHGIRQAPEDLKALTEHIEQAHPGTEVHVISLFDKEKSFKPMWKQVNGFRTEIKAIMQKNPNGVHLLCYSQGGLICRAVLYRIPYHNVHTFISLASPQAGQYGVPDAVLDWLISKKFVSSQCYKKGLQQSFCDYWNDPHRRSMYRNNSVFLAPINGDRPDPKMKVWKKSFLRIKNLVLIGGPDDGVITPWQSSFFGFYDKKDNVVEMKDQRFYRKNLFGLKTLDARGGISTCVRPGVEHTTWYSNFTVFKDCIEKWLI